MIAIFTIGLIIFIFYLFLKNKKKKELPTISAYEIRELQLKALELQRELENNNRVNRRDKASLPSAKDLPVDDSIIDITGESHKIDEQDKHPRLVKYGSGVPFWKHQYVYSFSEINAATQEQKKFYYRFKERFLKGEYLDLENNTNYAFILYFDLLDQYEGHKNLTKLETQFRILSQCYSKTEPYAKSSLAKLKEKEQNTEGVAGFNNLEDDFFKDLYYDYWKLGKKYKEELRLSDKEVKRLNKLLNPDNVFCAIDFCCKEVIKLYLKMLEELELHYKKEGTNIEERVALLADIIARKHFRYRKNSENYKYCIESTSTEIYCNLFKYCENAVRDKYLHKRKLSTETYYKNQEIRDTYEAFLIVKVVEILPNFTDTILPPDKDTEIELNSLTTTRWKEKFDELTKTYHGNISQFIDDIKTLGELNKKNPSVEHIFFEASKFLAPKDKVASLRLYLHYLYHDLHSEMVNNKKHSKTIQKSLFATKEQLHDFEKITDDLIKYKDLEKALKAVPAIYQPKRKKIELNTNIIKEVQEQHSDTVELLNEYLQDDFKDENHPLKSKEDKQEEAQVELASNGNSNDSIFNPELELTHVHIAVLDLFAKSNFTVTKDDLESFAQSKGIFRNQLIDSINDVCYEKIDDVLIEEDEDSYIIYEQYYQTLLAK